MGIASPGIFKDFLNTEDIQILGLIFHYRIITMKKINFQKDVLPHIIAVSIFLLLTIIFYHPAFFENKGLTPHDTQQWRASAKELIDYREETGKEGLWTNALFGGMPSYLVSVQWGDQPISVTHKIISLGIPHPVSVTFLCMLCFYIMLLCFKVNPYLGILGAITFAFSSYNIVGIAAGHNSRIAAIAFIPLVMGGVHICLSRNKWLGFGLTALAMSLHLRVNHLQITYYLIFILIIYGLVQLVLNVKNKSFKPFIIRVGLLLIAATLATGTFFGKFYSTYEYGKYSIRGKSELTKLAKEDNKGGLSKAYVFEYSNGIKEPLTLLMPNILGGPSSQPLPEDSNVANALRRAGANRLQLSQQLKNIPTYWGKQRITSPYYAGAIAVFLFVIGIIFVDKKHKVWLIILTILGILLSWGSNFPSFNYLMFDYFPGYSKFRSPTFAILLPVFSISLLGMLGLEKALNTPYNKIVLKKILIALACTGGISLLFALLAGTFSYQGAVDKQLPDWFAKALVQDRRALLKADALRAFAFISISFIFIYLFLIKKLSRNILIALLIITGTLDVMLVANRYLNQDNFHKKSSNQGFVKTAADKLIDSQKQLGDRVLSLNNPFNDNRTSSFHHAVGGYHAAKLRRYQELVENGITQDITGVIQQLRSRNPDLSEFQILNMLNTKFIIASLNDPNGVIVNHGANGPAWFVNDVVLVNSPDEELNKLQSIDTKTATVIDKSKFGTSFNTYETTNSMISLVDYKPGYWKYQSNNSENGLAVFSEIYYPSGFEVAIDGVPAEMLRANYVLRALEVPEGSHTIEFLFNPNIYHIGSNLMLICSILVISIFLCTTFFAWKHHSYNLTQVR